jgi:hypothetical protein
VRVLVDANVVFDVYEHRQPHFAASNQLFQRIRRGDLCAAVAPHTLANGFYLYGRPFRDFVEQKLLQDFEVCGPDAYLTRLCLGLGMSDLEDALQVGAALAWRASFIVTRNGKHFRYSTVPALTPTEFLNRFFRKPV